MQGNTLREAKWPDEAIQCYTMCIQLQLLGSSASGAVARARQVR